MHWVLRTNRTGVEIPSRILFYISLRNKAVNSSCSLYQRISHPEKIGVFPFFIRGHEPQGKDSLSMFGRLELPLYSPWLEWETKGVRGYDQPSLGELPTPEPISYGQVSESPLICFLFRPCEGEREQLLEEGCQADSLYHSAEIHLFNIHITNLYWINIYVTVFEMLRIQQWTKQTYWA